MAAAGAECNNGALVSNYNFEFLETQAYKFPQKITKLRNRAVKSGSHANMKRFMRAFENEIDHIVHEFGYKYWETHNLQKCGEVLQNCINLEEFLKCFAVYFKNQKSVMKPYRGDFDWMLRECFKNLNFTIGFFRYKIIHLWLEDSLKHISVDAFYRHNSINWIGGARMMNFSSSLGTLLKCCYKYSALSNRLRHMPEFKSFLKKFSKRKVQKLCFENEALSTHQQKFLSDCGQIRCLGCDQEQGSETPKRFSKCSRCHLAFYCGKNCQVKHWKNVHRKECFENL
jgi:hypothetical protein